MSLFDERVGEAQIEECIEALDEFCMSFEHLPRSAVAIALGTQLGGVLATLLDEGQCTIAELRELLREIERGAVQAAPAATP